MIRAFFAVIITTLLLFTSCESQQVITRPAGFMSGNVTSMQEDITDAVLFYSLPRTVINIDVVVRQTVKKPGPYARFAKRFLGLDDVIFLESSKYDIQSIKMNSFAEPDPDHLYYLVLPDNIMENTYLVLSESGLIAGLSKKPGIGFQKDPYQYTKEFGKHESKIGFNYFMNVNLTERIDTVIEYVFEDTVRVPRKTFHKSITEKSLEQRAGEAAEHILAIREKKLDLISGFQEIPYTKEALKFMHAELSKLENDYLELFTGITTHSIKQYRFLHRPAKEDASKQHNIFYFSSSEGIITDLSKLIYMKDEKPLILKYNTSNATDALNQKIKNNLQTLYPTFKGIHYRIPEYADIDVFIGSEHRAKSRMLINQFGVVTALPSKNMEVDFYHNTGSIRSFGIEKHEE